MHIQVHLQGTVNALCGGYSNVRQSMYKGVRVAVKVIRMAFTDGIDDILSVGLLLASSNSYV